jgi:hypothetical protein
VSNPIVAYVFPVILCVYKNIACSLYLYFVVGGEGNGGGGGGRAWKLLGSGLGVAPLLGRKTKMRSSYTGQTDIERDRRISLSRLLRRALNNACLAHFQILKLEAICSSENTVNIYHTIRHHISDDSSLQSPQTQNEYEQHDSQHRGAVHSFRNIQ